MMKKLTVALLAIIICLSFAAFSASAATESLTEVPKGYTGVYTIEDLYCIRNNLSGNYILMNDIDLTEATAKGGDWDFGGNGWNPIGSNDEYDDLEFSGIFNGNGHSITGMRIEVTKTPSDAGACIYYGLFSFVSGEVENLTLTGEITSSITKKKTIFAGGIAARSSGDISNCNVKVSVNVKNDCSDSQTFYDVYAGGIVGWNIGDISHCCNLADVYAYVRSGYTIAQSFYYSNAYAGGICGYDDGSGHIYASYNTGNIATENKAYDAKSYGGGICGYGGRSTSGYIENCYNTGNVSTRTGNFTIYNSTFATGGIVYYYAGDIVNCYNSGTVTGITNYAISSSPAEKCYYLSGTGEDSSGATSLTAAQMKLKAMYSNWDFEKVWTIEGRTDYLYPELRYMPHYSANEIPLHEHNYSAVRTEPTHTAEGKVVYTCKSCGDSYTEKLAKLEGHSYCKTEEKDSTCTSEGYVLYSCECGDTYTEKKEKLSHNFTEKIIDNAHLVSAATKESPAVYRYDCSACDTISEDLTFTYGEKIGPLGKTDSITAAQNTSAIKLTWNEVETATVYRVYRKNNGSWVKLADVNTNTYTISKLSAGTKYSFAVKAGRLYDGKIEWASGYTTIGTATKPAGTTNLKFSAQTADTVTLSWSAVKGADGYRVYKYDPATGKYPTVGYVAGKTSFTVKNLTASTKYKFKVRAYINTDNGAVWGDYTDVITAATKPGKITNLKPSSQTTDTITLTWSAVAGVDGYRFYKYNSSTGKYSTIGYAAGKTTFNMKDLTVGTKYKIRARAYINTDNGAIWGDYTDVITVSTKSARTTGLKVSAYTANTVALTWNAVKGADGYRVYKYDPATGKYPTVGYVAGKTSFTVKNLTASTKYKFKVRAYINTDNGAVWGDYTDVITAATKPGKITNLKPSSQTTDTITLTWSAVAGVDGYRFYKYNSSTGKYSTIGYAAGKTTFNMKDLYAGDECTIKARAYINTDNGAIWGDYTDVVTVATQPENVTSYATIDSVGKIKLTWDAVRGADVYVIYYKVNSGSYTRCYVSDKVETIYFKNLNSNTKYTFAVRAGIKTSFGNVYGGYNPVSIKLSNNFLTDAKATQLWQEAYDVYYNWASWGLYDNYIDKSRPVYFDGAGSLPYYPIVDHSFDSKADLRAYLYNYFDGVITEEILSWIYEYKGVMYTRMPTGRASIPFMNSVVVKSQSATYAELYITFVRSNGEQETFIQKMSFVNGKWIFAERFYDRPKYDY